MDWLSFFAGLAGGIGALVAGKAAVKHFEANRSPGSRDDWKSAEKEAERLRKQIRDREDAKK